MYFCQQLWLPVFTIVKNCITIIKLQFLKDINHFFIIMVKKYLVSQAKMRNTFKAGFYFQKCKVIRLPQIIEHLLHLVYL